MKQERWTIVRSFTCDECQKIGVLRAKSKRSPALPSAWLELRFQWDLGPVTYHYCSQTCLAAATEKRAKIAGWK